MRRAIDEHRLIVILRPETLWRVGVKELGDPHVQVVPPLQRRPARYIRKPKHLTEGDFARIVGHLRRSATGPGVAITFGDGSAASLRPAQKELPDTASGSSSQTRRQLKPACDFPDGPRRHQHPATGGGAGPRGNRGPARVRGSSIAKVRPPGYGSSVGIGNGSQPVSGGSALCDTLVALRSSATDLRGPLLCRHCAGRASDRRTIKAVVSAGAPGRVDDAWSGSAGVLTVVIALVLAASGL